MSMDYTIIRPSEGKLFANADETELYSALILAPNDSIDNYHEVDIPEPVEPELEPEPDYEDEFPYIPPEEEPEAVPLTRLELTAKVAELEANLDYIAMMTDIDLEEEVEYA